MKDALVSLAAAWLFAAMIASGMAGAADASAEEAPTEETAGAEEGAKPKRGRTIKGNLTPPGRVRKAYLWDRGTDLKVPVEVDPRTGAFEVTGLRLGTYDLMVETPWGRLEGVDMAPKISEYDALIPPEYRTEDMGLEVGGTPSEEDLKAIRRHIYEVRRHENKIRDLLIRGTADKAVVLIELILDRPFVGRKGDEIVWRMEQWYYEKKYDSWTRFRTRVLARHRVSKREWERWGWMFEPKVGGLTITEDRTEPIVVEYEIPAKPDPKMGLAGTRLPPPHKK